MPDMVGTFRSANAPTRQQQRRRYDIKREQESPWRRWYKTARWQRTRKHQLNDEPLCVFCLELGIREPATVCDHVDKHNGDPEKFWAGPFQSLCGHCHNSTKQSQEKST